MAGCDILILMAMQAEAQGIIEKYSLQPITGIANLPAKFYQGTYQHQRLVLATHGQAPDQTFDFVGTQFAALTAWHAIHHFQPTYIINAGTAGGFKDEAKIGDVFINARGCRYHDRKIAIDAYQHFCYQIFPSQIAVKIANALPGLLPGLISTGNSLDTTSTEIQALKQNHVQAKEMEAASIAEVAALFDKEIIALKAITDHLDGIHVSADEFMANLHFAGQQLTQALDKIIQHIAQSKDKLTQGII